MSYYTFHKPVAPEPLPATLPPGARSVVFKKNDVDEFRYELAGEATLNGVEYHGDWRCEGRKGTSFVRCSVVDWDHVRAAQVSS